jgi:hypothetical protein
MWTGARSARFPTRAGAVGGLLVALVLMALGPGAATASTPPPAATLSLAGNGSLSVTLSFAVANGSALRYAMDGNFTPLIDLLPVNASTRASLLAVINQAEANPLAAGLFGDRDGSVTYATDVVRFESLVIHYARQFPPGTFAGALNVSLKGTSPSSEALQAITFTNATGPDASTAPIGITTALAVGFPVDASGSGTFRIVWNLPPLSGNVSPPVAPVGFRFTGPPGDSIRSVSGLDALRVSNDPWGYSSPVAAGQYTPLPGHDVAVAFAPAFPTGTVAIAAGAAAGIGGAVAAVLVRRRRKRRSPPWDAAAAAAAPARAPSSEPASITSSSVSAEGEPSSGSR